MKVHRILNKLQCLLMLIYNCHAINMEIMSKKENIMR